MRAIIASADGPTVADVPEPEPGPGEVLVQVHAAALNRIDLRMSRGVTHGTSGGVGMPCGMESSGEVVAVGADVERWTVGDRVMGVGPYAFAELRTAHQDSLLTVPADLGHEEATTLPGGLLTMHDALVARGGFEAGQSVLVQGASSGMGLMGLQIARRLGASCVIGTSTSAERRERLGEFGADVVLDSKDPGWVAQVHDATGDHGVDLLLDLVAGPLVTPGMQALRIGGTLVNIGRVGGEQGEVDFDLHSLRRITYVGTTFRTREAGEVAEVVRSVEQALGAAVAAREITMPVDSVHKLDDAVPAFARMAENRHFGKIVLRAV